MELNILFNNLTVLSVLKLIVGFQDYRVIYVYAANLTKDISSAIAEIASSYMVPVSITNFDQIQSHNRSKSEDPVLNVIVANNLYGTNDIIQVKRHLEQNDVTVILLTMNNTNFSPAEIPLLWTKLSIKVLILSKAFLLCLNQFRIEDIDYIVIDPMDIAATKQFIKHHLSDKLSADGAEINIFFSHSPPLAAVSTLGGDKLWYFTGPDGALSELLVKYLNFSPNYWSDVGVRYPSFVQWRDYSTAGSRLHYRRYYKEAMTKNVISMFNKSLDDDHIDLYMFSNMIHTERDMTGALNLLYDRLYPYGKDCLIFIVPVQDQVGNFLTTFIKHGDIQSVLIVLLLFVLSRIIIRRAVWNHVEWFWIVFITLQFFLVQGQIKNQNAIEEIWTNIFRGFSLFGTTATSAIMYKSLIDVRSNEVDTIDQLIASNLTIAVPSSVINQFKMSSARFKSLYKSQRIDFMKDDSISSYKNLSCAYVYRETSAQFMSKLFGFESRNTGSQKIRIMKERLNCEPTSYRIAKNSPFKNLINKFVQRFYEMGLYNKHLEWEDRINDAIYESYKDKVPEKLKTVFGMDTAVRIFALYFAGICMSCVVFIAEIIIIPIFVRIRRS